MPERNQHSDRIEYLLEPDWSIVRRVEHESGSHVEPALDEAWPDLWKLRWHAAVVASTTGLRIQIDDADVKLNGVPLAGRYNIRCGSSTASVGSYRDAWTQLNGIETGAHQALAAGWRPPAQRPPLGYVTVDLQSENPPSLIEADREIASQQLADDRAASPLGDWVLLEVREVQP